MEEEHRQRVWVLYGWFSGLMCVGSVFGAVAWAFWMQALVALFTGDTPGLSNAQSASLNAQGQYWTAAFFVAYAIEFLCLSVAKLLVLHRMADFAVPKSDGLSRRLAVGGRVVMAAVVVGNVVGLCANVAAAVLSKQAGDLFNAAAAAFASNSTDAANSIVVQADQKTSVADDAASVQQPDGPQARRHGLAIDVDGAGPAKPFAADGLCAGKALPVAQNIQQRGAWVDLERDGLAGQGQFDRHVIPRLASL